MNASRHRCLNEWPNVLVLDGSLILVHSALVVAIDCGNILKIALTTLVANWAIERVIGKEELHHTTKDFDIGLKRCVKFTYPLAILVFSDLVKILRSGLTWVAQAAYGFGTPSNSTKHILQLPATESLS